MDSQKRDVIMVAYVKYRLNHKLPDWHLHEVYEYLELWNRKVQADAQSQRRQKWIAQQGEVHEQILKDIDKHFAKTKTKRWDKLGWRPKNPAFR